VDIWPSPKTVILVLTFISLFFKVISFKIIIFCSILLPNQPTMIYRSIPGRRIDCVVHAVVLPNT